MPHDWLPWLLQCNDSQFPSGAYAHSLGLEDLCQQGLVKNAESLEIYLREQVTPALLHFELPMLKLAHQAAEQGELTQLIQLDEQLEAWRLATELRQASRQMGSRRLALVRKLKPDPLLEDFAAALSPQHQVIVAGIELRSAPLTAALFAFSMQTFSGCCMAAVKLMRLGQERCQTLIYQALSEISPKLKQLSESPRERIGWFNPLLEISSMRHARANERLFIS